YSRAMCYSLEERLNDLCKKLVVSAPRVHSNANPNISSHPGAVPRQLYAAASAAVSRASHATPSNARREGCSIFQPVGVSQRRGSTSRPVSLFFQLSQARLPPSRCDSESRIYLLISLR